MDNEEPEDFYFEIVEPLSPDDVPPGRKMIKGQVISVRADGTQFVFDSIDEDGAISGFLILKNGARTEIGLMDMFTKVGNWKRVDQ